MYTHARPQCLTSSRFSPQVGRHAAAQSRARLPPPHVAAPDTRSQTALSQFSSDDIGKPVSAAEFQRLIDSYSSQPVERSFIVDDSQVEGVIPRDLHGTLYRNGPGNFEFGSQRITAPFDGDGLLASYAFHDGSVIARRKFVRTRHMREELKAGKLLFKGAFTVGDPSGRWSNPFDFSVREPANTGVVNWGGHTMALHEAGLPHTVDGALRTLAAATTMQLWEEGDAVAAHYRVSQEADGSERLVMFSPAPAGTDMRLKIVELDESGNKVEGIEVMLQDAAFAFMHDMMVTDNYYVVFENPIRMDFQKLVTKYVFGQACIAECLYLDKSRQTKIHCLPRPGKSGVARPVYTAAPGFSFHHINAYEANGAVVVDTLSVPNMEFKLDFDNIDVSQFVTKDKMTCCKRLVLRGDSPVAEETDFRNSPELSRIMEFPAPPAPGFSGRPYSCWFGTANRAVPAGQWGLTQEVVRFNCPSDNGVTGPFDFSAVSTTAYYPGDGRYCGEPIFVPRRDSEGKCQGEDDGYLLVQVSDMRNPANKFTCLEILDAADVAAGPVARINLPDMLPPGLHGSWSTEYCGVMPDEQLPSVNDVRVNF